MAEKMSTSMSNRRLRRVLMGHEKLLLRDNEAKVLAPRVTACRTKLNEYLIAWEEVAKKDDLVAKWLPRMTQVRDDLKTTLEAISEGAKAVAKAVVNEWMTRLEAVALWDSNYGELYGMFPGDRTRVEFFFPTIRAQAHQVAFPLCPDRRPPGEPAWCDM